MVTSLLIALPLMDYATSLLSASAQQINATASNEISTRATLITKNKTGSVNDTGDEARKLYDQGHALLELKKFNEATSLFDKALAINPNSTRALSEKGHSLLMLKKFNEAIGLFDKALAINPNNTDVLNDKQTALDALSRQK